MKKKDTKVWMHHSCCSGIGFGVLLLLLGLYFLAKDLGWISSSVSLWPILLIAFGAYIVFKGKNR